MNDLTILRQRYEEIRSRNLKLDMSRGKPCKEQLDLSSGLINCLSEKEFMSEGIDCRNYGGGADGLPEAKELFRHMLGVNVDEIIIGGNSSLNLMYDTISRALTNGLRGSKKPWGKYEKVKFICPSPGYDRHFAITEFLGIEMLPVDMTPEGPDMDKVEELAASDESVKGIWCVPMYSNPDGISYSDATVRRFAELKTAADDFKIMWDNSYAIHHLYETPDQILNILRECQKAGCPDRPLIFSSTSKITFPGSGLAMMAGSADNIKHTIKQMSYQTICPNKMNQLRHVKFFGKYENIEAHMKKHAEILGPKFALVNDIFERELGRRDIAWWNNPRGGYFISLFTLDGKATKAFNMAKEAGLTLTAVGNTYPYGKDPRDRNIRIAPTMPPIDELRTAMELLSICIRIVSCEEAEVC